MVKTTIYVVKRSREIVKKITEMVKTIIYVVKRSRKIVKR